jgi:hypothetical protein
MANNNLANWPIDAKRAIPLSIEVVIHPEY